MSSPHLTPAQFKMMDSVGVADEEIYDDAPSSVLTAAADQLYEEYSSVRQGNSNWMIHCFMDTAVKMFSPIVAAYEKRL